ncbi:MAG: alpha/beta hydrolase [Solirubrobacterales bacterium]
MSAVRERLEALAARGISALPDRVTGLLAGRPIRIDGQELHPQVRLALRLEGLVGGSEMLPVAEARERRRHDARVFRGPTIEVGAVTELAIPGPAGEIPARLYRPAGDRPSPPLVVYYHGGGHVIGDLDTHDQPCRFLAREIPAIVLAVDYRMGPEHRFPAAVDDALAAFRWACDQSGALGADPERVAVAGDSAGGNLATVVAQLTAADGGPAPCFQGLIYPTVDYSSERRSYDLFGEGFFLTREEMDWFRENYFADEANRLDPRASPILAPDLAGLAPAFVLTCGFDPLRDEGEAYAERLREAGVPVTQRREADLVHGFINAVGLGGRAEEAMGEAAAAMRKGLAGDVPGAAVSAGGSAGTVSLPPG